MKIALSCETTVDLPDEMLKKNDIHIIPFTISFGDETIADYPGISERIFESVAKTKSLPKTHSVNAGEYKKYFSDLLKNYDGIIHVCLGSKISSTYSHAVQVATELGTDKVRIIDSGAVSTGIAVLVLYARKLIDKGLNLEDIAYKVQSRAPYVQLSFVLDTLEYLYKGGRCNTMQYLGANLFRIKLEIMTKDGELCPGKKFIGSLSSAVRSYSRDIFKHYTNPDLENGFVTYSSAEDKDIEYLKGELKKRGFKNIYNTSASGTISSHCGPKCIGIAFINDGGEEE